MSGLRFIGRITDLDEATHALLLDRATDFERFVDAVRPIRDAVREDGDAALAAFTEKFDGTRPERVLLERADMEAALARVPAELKSALEAARVNVERFHRAQRHEESDLEVVPGLTAGRRVIPLQRVGAYVPGGRAAYPSTVIMTVIPAKVAGVPDVIVATPPGKDGLVPDVTLAACAIAGADRVLVAGGAQAVFALAYGTATVPRVDKIVGPGNAFVAAAKTLVNARVATDAPAGPSEVLVLHEGAFEADWPALAAAELVAQAEHDPEAACACVTTDAAFADAVVAEVARQVADAPRKDVIEAALAKRGAVLVAADAAEARAFADAFAPEHLLVLTVDDRDTLDVLRNYGSAFLGPWSTVALGDYCAGPNHVLPTAGLARSHSGLSVDDFVRRPTHQRADAVAISTLGPIAERLATFEGLHAHAAAVRARQERRDAASEGDRV